jgi:hypothetical protein
LPGVLLLLGLIFTFIRPYCGAPSTVAIILGILSVIFVLLPACVTFNDTKHIKGLFVVASIFCIVNFIMEAICRVSIHEKRRRRRLEYFYRYSYSALPTYLSQNRYASYVALAFWALGAIVTAMFSSNLVDIVEVNSSSETNATASAPGIEIQSSSTDPAWIPGNPTRNTANP